MDLAVRKLHLLEQFMKIGSVDKIERLEKFFKTEIQEEIEKPELLLKLLEKSKEDSKLGKVRPHEEVMKEVQEKYNIVL